MSAAFANNTANLYSSDFTRNSASKTNYNYLRLLSEKNNKKCTNNRFTNYSGNIVLSKPITHKSCNVGDTGDTGTGENNSSTDTTLSKLTSVRSYNMLHSINNGFYLPTVITNTTGNIQIYRPPYTYDKKCHDLCVKDDNYTLCCTPNTSGNLQEILHNEYLDFGDLTVITNIQTITPDEEPIPYIQKIGDNSVLRTDIAINDYIIDPENLYGSFKDCNLVTLLNLHDTDTSSDTDTGSDTKEISIVNWRDFYLFKFPNNKYKKFSMNNPIQFYSYKECDDKNEPDTLSPQFGVVDTNDINDIQLNQEIGTLTITAVGDT